MAADISKSNGAGIPAYYNRIEENEIFEIVGTPVKIVNKNGSINTFAFMRDRHGEIWAVELPENLPNSKFVKMVDGELKEFPPSN